MRAAIPLLKDVLKSFLLIRPQRHAAHLETSAAPSGSGSRNGRFLLVVLSDILVMCAVLPCALRILDIADPVTQACSLPDSLPEIRQWLAVLLLPGPKEELRKFPFKFADQNDIVSDLCLLSVNLEVDKNGEHLLAVVVRVVPVAGADFAVIDDPLIVPDRDVHKL
jgi:hypothetical protein